MGFHVDPGRQAARDGVGAYPTVSIEKARKKAEGCRVHVQEWLDPIAERDKDVGKTFGQCCDVYIEAMKPSRKNEKHIAQWEMTLKHYCAPIREKRVSMIDTAHVLSVLQPIWLEKPETASRLRGRIERVLCCRHPEAQEEAPSGNAIRGRSGIRAAVSRDGGDVWPRP